MSMSMKIARAQTQGSGRVMPGIGDPGLFGFLGGIAKTAIQSIPGPVGALAGKFFRPPQAQATPGIVSNGRTISFSPLQQQVPTPGVGAAIERFFPGGSSGFGPGVAQVVTGQGVTIACPTGHHPNKTDYFLKGGEFIQKGTRCVKNRRRNPLNARAADRAISRIESAKRATKRLARVTIKKKC